jgi:hypothetical protein
MTERIICEVDEKGRARVVYPPDSEHRIICGSDDTYATQAEVQAVADDLCSAVDGIEARLEALENAQRTAPPDLPLDEICVLMWPLSFSNGTFFAARKVVGDWLRTQRK